MLTNAAACWCACGGVAAAQHHSCMHRDKTELVLGARPGLLGLGPAKTGTSWNGLRIISCQAQGRPPSHGDPGQINQRIKKGKIEHGWSQLIPTPPAYDPHAPKNVCTKVTQYGRPHLMSPSSVMSQTMEKDSRSTPGFKLRSAPGSSSARSAWQ
jgi:hypothetical protein